MKRAGFCSWIVGLALALPAAALAEEAYTTTAVNLRAGPDADYPLVRWVPENTAVNVHGCLADYRWCDVEVYGDRGWMSASFLVYPYQNSNVSVITYGPVIGLPLIGFHVDSYWDDHYRRRPWYGDRHNWAHRYRPEFEHPRHYPPQHRPPQYYPPAARPEFRPPLAQPYPVPPPVYRQPDRRFDRQPDRQQDRQYDRERYGSPAPGYGQPPAVRAPGPPPSARPPGPPPQMARPPSQPPRPSTQGPTVRGRDPQGLRDNSGERGGMNTGNF